MNKRNLALAQKITNTQLRQDNHSLRRSLRQFVRVVKRNLDIQQKMDEIGHLILKCDDFESLVMTVTGAIKADFGLTAVTICLVSRFGAIVGLPRTGRKPSPIAERLFFMEEGALARFFSDQADPVLHGCIEHGSVDFFGIKVFRRIRSQAMIPLFYGKSILGSLNLGSNERMRYREKDSADFLKRLAQVLSLALANIEFKRETDSVD